MPSPPIPPSASDPSQSPSAGTSSSAPLASDTSAALHHLQALFSVTSHAASTPQAALDTLLGIVVNHGRQFEDLVFTHQLSTDHRLALITLALAQQLNQDFAPTVQIFSHQKISDVSLNRVK
ncbi:hypothetical protein HDU96_001904, partial [Phlyctochytrium bullatum]